MNLRKKDKNSEELEHLQFLYFVHLYHLKLPNNGDLENLLSISASTAYECRL